MAKVVVVYGGGFQPFHVGHLSSYLQAKKAFPNADFYVTASDNTDTRPIPFKEKQWLGQQAGVLPQDFRNVAVKSPLNPVEILSQYNPNEDIFILVRSERDPVPYKRKDGSPSYYQPFQGLDKCVPFNSQGGHGYVFVTKKEDFSINGNQVYSGTQVRELYQQANDTGRNRIVKDMYPKSPNQSKIRQILDMYIGSPAEPKQAKVAKPKASAVKKLQANRLQERILKVIQTARPMLSEATLEQKVKLVKIMKEAISEEKKRLDPSCWKGYHKAGTKMKGDTRVNNCVPNESATAISEKEQDVAEEARIERKEGFRGRTTPDVEYIVRDENGNIVRVCKTKKEAKMWYDMVTLSKEEMFVKYPELKVNEDYIDEK